LSVSIRKRQVGTLEGMHRFHAKSFPQKRWSVTLCAWNLGFLVFAKSGHSHILFRGGRLLFLGHARHDFLELYLTPLHTPFTALLVCLALAQFFCSQIRKTAFMLLYSGCLSHFLLDFLQRTIEGAGLHSGTIGGYHWLFPLSWLDYQFGLFRAEQAPYALLFLIPISVGFFVKAQRESMKGMRGQYRPGRRRVAGNDSVRSS
jgi:hypothetical protein